MSTQQRTVYGLAVTLLGLLLFVAVLAAPTFVLAAGLGALGVRVASAVQDVLGRTSGRQELLRVSAQ